MALSKSKTLANGATGSYWRISNATLDKQTMIVTYTVVLCQDQAHKDAPLATHRAYQMAISVDNAKGDLVAQGYTYIKAKAASSVPNLGTSGTHIYDTDLSGATDV